MKNKFLLLFCISSSLFASETFIVTFKGVRAIVEPQSDRGNFIGLTLKNDTFKRLRGELRNEEVVLKRYSLRPGSSFSYQVNHSEYKKLYLTNLAPAFDTIPLIIGTEKYAIPK